MKSFKVSKTMLKKAKTYMPLNDKENLAKQIAKLSVKDMKTAGQNRKGQKILAMPSLKKEDTAMKKILLVHALLGYYLNVQIPEETEDSYVQYDYYAGGHILNQFEQFKSDPELEHTVRSILTDYRELEEFTESEINSIKVNNNDPIARFTAAIQILSTPENIKELVGMLKDESDNYTELLKKKKIIDESRVIEMKKGIKKNG